MVGLKRGDIIDLTVKKLEVKKRLRCSLILTALRSRHEFFEDEGGLGQQVKFPFYVFAFTTLPLCWYPLFYAKSKSKFSQLACSDKKVKTDRLFWAKFA